MRIVRFLSIGLVGVLVPYVTFAQATRTWVSGVGDDVNPCSRTAPCKTFAGTISKTAANGEIDTLDPGGWGAVTITKSITIDGGSWAGGILVSSGNGITINTGANDVVIIRNLVIIGLGTAARGISIVNVNGGGTVRLENVEISGTATACVSLSSSGTTLTINKSIFRECGSTGQGLAAGGVPAQQTVDVNGLIVQNSSTAISLGSNVSAVLRNLEIDSNTLGVLADASTAACTVSIHDSMISHNTVGVQTVAGSPTIRLDRNIITLNNTGLQLGGGTIVSFNNNVISFNGSDGNPNQTAALR